MPLIVLAMLFLLLLLLVLPLSLLFLLLLLSLLLFLQLLPSLLLLLAQFRILLGSIRFVVTSVIRFNRNGLPARRSILNDVVFRALDIHLDATSSLISGRSNESILLVPISISIWCQFDCVFFGIEGSELDISVVGNSLAGSAVVSFAHRGFVFDMSLRKVNTDPHNDADGGNHAEDDCDGGGCFHDGW